jgi:hypothetical protein
MAYYLSIPEMRMQLQRNCHLQQDPARSSGCWSIDSTMY